MSTTAPTLVEDLYRVPDGQKAEIIAGKVVLMSPTGRMPSYAAKRIVRSLDDYSDLTGMGEAVQDNAGFLVNLPQRRSFSPDAAFYTGSDTPDSMRFFADAPIFAIEVRSEGDYGPAEQAMAAKRRDYFAAGTHVVWEVDLLGLDIVRVYRAERPDQPTPSTAGARWPKPNPLCPVGPCQWRIYFSARGNTNPPRCLMSQGLCVLRFMRRMGRWRTVGAASWPRWGGAYPDLLVCYPSCAV
ncbi:MAG: Uma2 family endonuclease, partial [Chloroflexota bacterium]|nr:Uma2 family endonuclease [Chloroflexota bacterium]